MSVICFDSVVRVDKNIIRNTIIRRMYIWCKIVINEELNLHKFDESDDESDKENNLDSDCILIFFLHYECLKLVKFLLLY